MPVMTIRLSEEEQKILSQRSRKAGLRRSTFVRQLIREQPYETALDVLEGLAPRMGDARLRIGKRSKRRGL
jgi:hypothetical protein